MLAARGFDVAVSAARVPKRRMAGSSGALALVAEHGVRYLQRGVELRRLARQRRRDGATRRVPVGPSTLLRSFDRFEGRLVYDLDDAIFLPTPTLARGRRRPLAYSDRQSLACYGVPTRCGEHTRARWALPNRRADLVLQTIPDVWTYGSRARTGGSLRLGWIGSQGNLRYLEPLREVLERLAEEGVASLEVVSAAPGRARRLSPLGARG